MKYNSFSSKIFTLAAGTCAYSGHRFEYMSLAQSLAVSKEISKVLQPGLSPAERKYQVREIALILAPEVTLIDETSYWDSRNEPNEAGDIPVRNFVSLSTKEVDIVTDLMMWYGQYNIHNVDAKHVFCVSNLGTGNCIVFQRTRYKS